MDRAMTADSSRRDCIGVESPKDMTAISLFSGCGGLDIGLSRAGFSFKFQIDSDEDCHQTLLLNKNEYWKESTIVQDKIENWRTEEILRATGLSKGQATLVCGGPPCQNLTERTDIDRWNKRAPRYCPL
jgi:site-specific DNA-cytosine methylase